MPSAIKPLILVVFLLIIACTEKPREPLRIGTNVWAGYEPLYLARDLGYFESNKIRLIEYTSTSQVLKGYRNGLLDAAALTLDEAIILLSTGEQCHIILVMDISNGGDALLGQAEIEKISDLKNKRIGVEHTALGAYFISRTLDYAGLVKSDVIIVPMDIDRQKRAFIQREVDAVVTFEPIRSKLISVGANKLFDSSQIPGEIVDVLVIRSSKLSQFDAQIEQLKTGWFKALDYYQQNTIAALKIMNKRMALEDEELKSAFSGIILPDTNLNQLLLNEKPESDLLLTARKMSQLMYENKLVSSLIDTDVLFDNPTD